MSDVKKVHVDGKLYDIKDSKSVATLGNWPSIATLDEFVKLTATTHEQVNRGYSFIFRDTGGWGPRKTKNDWYRCLIVRYQNPIGTQWDVTGTVILTSGPSIYLGYISGTTTFTVTWYSLVEEGGTMREAVPASLGGNCALNGHFVAGHTGWTAMTSHDQNNINTRYRFQLGGDGVLYVFKTTQGDGGYSAIGRVLRDDQICVWTSKALTVNTSYVSNLAYSNCYYNAALKLATANINCGINTVAASGQVLISGFPKSVSARAPFCISQGTSTAPAARVYINQSGQLIADGPVQSVGWYNGSVTYPYSSL